MRDEPLRLGHHPRATPASRGTDGRTPRLSALPVTLQAMDSFEDLLTHGIKQHVHQVAPILARGDVAVLVYRATPAAEQAALDLGWDRTPPAFALDALARETCARAFECSGDSFTAGWLRRPGGGRIFVITAETTFLVNYSREAGYSIATRSTDAEYWL